MYQLTEEFVKWKINICKMMILDDFFVDGDVE